MTYFAIISAALGFQMLGRVSEMTIVVLAFLMGGIMGYVLKLDRRVEAIARQGTGGSQTDAPQALLVAFTLFCISTAGILGAVELGFSGDVTLLTTKAAIDFLSAVFFPASCGWILSVICIPLGAILLLSYLLSACISPYLTAAAIGNFSACGGLIQLANALRIAKLKAPPVLDLAPSLVFVIPHTYLALEW